MIRTISSANPLWGTPRIVGELGKLGIEVAKSTVDKYRVRSRNAPSPTWRAFLKSHLNELVSIDFLVVPTIRFKLLYGLDPEPHDIECRHVDHSSTVGCDLP